MIKRNTLCISNITGYHHDMKAVELSHDISNQQAMVLLTNGTVCNFSNTPTGLNFMDKIEPKHSSKITSMKFHRQCSNLAAYSMNLSHRSSNLQAICVQDFRTRQNNPANLIVSEQRYGYGRYEAKIHAWNEITSLDFCQFDIITRSLFGLKQWDIRYCATPIREFNLLSEEEIEDNILDMSASTHLPKFQVQISSCGSYFYTGTYVKEKVGIGFKAYLHNNNSGLYLKLSNPSFIDRCNPRNYTEQVHELKYGEFLTELNGSIVSLY
jgi:hypothetical protein